MAMEDSVTKISENIRIALQNEFENRCKRNSSYSLRAYARSLGIDSSLFSKFINGRRKIPVGTGRSIIAQLGISPAQVNQAVSEGLDYDTTLSDDIFQILGHWQHFAITELIKTNMDVSSLNKIAQVLDITKSEVQFSIERLQRVGLITIENGKILSKSNNIEWNKSHYTNAARQRLQKQLLEKSIEALYKVAIEKREHSSLTVACNRNSIERVKEKIQIFKKELDKDLDSESSKDSVYQLTISFFPLTDNGGECQR